MDTTRERRDTKTTENQPDTLAVLPLRETVVFPEAVVPILVGKDRSKALVRELVDGEAPLLALTLTTASGDEPGVDDLTEVATMGRIVQLFKFPDGNFELQAVGSFQNQIEANRRLMWIVPAVLAINLLILYLDFRNLPIAIVVFSGIPVAFAGGMIAVAVTGVAMNTAVWVGFIALFGIAVDDGVVMATYIQQVLKRRRIETVDELRGAIYQAGVRRIRPCVMTTITTLAALLPVMFSTGRGADVARAMALPVFGGMLVEPFTSFIVPTMYCAYMEIKLRIGLEDQLLSASDGDRRDY